MDKLATLKVKNSISFKALESGETEVSFVVDKLTYSEKNHVRAALEGAGEALTLALSKFRQKRSLNANNYAWVLLQKLAEERGQTKEEVYREFIKQYGIFRPVTVNKEAAETLEYIWQKNGLGWVVEETGRTDESVDLLMYYGSSTYSTRQMARLLDAIVNDCKQCGIETLPPEQIEEMKRAWRREG